MAGPKTTTTGRQERPEQEEQMFPALRADLIWTRPAGAKGAAVLKCTRTDRFYRFGPVEVLILRLLDSATPAEITAEVEAHTGDSLELVELDAFVSSLAARGLLKDSGVQPVKSPPRPRVRGSLLYIRFKAFDPEKLLSRLSPRVQFAFTRTFVNIATCLIVAGFLLFLANSDEIGFDMVQLLRPETLIPAWIVILLSTIIHEFAHALTCRHFGGRVREMGFMLIFFQPALYANVSDAWLFDEKWKRVWVTFAGGFIDLFVWALAVIAWRFFAPETTAHFVATIVIATAGLRTFFNLNPLIKLDGYYLLSDWLEIPNLRQKAFTYVKSQLSFDRQHARAVRQSHAPRERRILFRYGVLGALFMALFLAFILSRIGGWLVGEFQAWGFLLFCVLLYLVVGRWLCASLRSLFSRRHAAHSP